MHTTYLVGTGGTLISVGFSPTVTEPQNNNTQQTSIATTTSSDEGGD